MQGYLAIPRGDIGHLYPYTPTPVHLRRPQYFGPEPAVGSHHAPGRMLPPWPQRSPPTTPPTALVRSCAIRFTPGTFFIYRAESVFGPSLLPFSNSKMFCAGYLEVTKLVLRVLGLSYVAPSKGLPGGREGCCFWGGGCFDFLAHFCFFMFFMFPRPKISALLSCNLSPRPDTTPLCSSIDGIIKSLRGVPRTKNLARTSPHPTVGMETAGATEQRFHQGGVVRPKMVSSEPPPPALFSSHTFLCRNSALIQPR